MPALKIQNLLSEMLGAAKDSLGSQWPAVKDLAASSLRKIAASLVEIEQLRAKGAITEEQASLLVSMEKNTFKIVMLSIEGMGLLAVEAALNAALDVVRTAVNTALGFALL